MKNFKFTIEYDGTNYFGWQRQSDNKKFPTIQGTLEKALQKIFNKRITVTASGRTDTGVHALGQVGSFKVSTKIPASNILRALNTYLPEDIVVKDIKQVPLSFNPRFNAKKKWYRYTILHRSSVFNRHYAVYYPYEINLRLMRQAGRIMKGRHKMFMRKIHKVDLKKNGEFIYIDIIGEGFLYKMVRRIVGILIDVGRGKIKMEDVDRLISGYKIGSEIQTAPARGLMLMKVYY